MDFLWFHFDGQVKRIAAINGQYDLSIFSLVPTTIELSSGSDDDGVAGLVDGNSCTKLGAHDVLKGFSRGGSKDSPIFVTGQDNTAEFLRPIMQMGVAPSLDALQQSCAAGVRRADGTRFLLPVYQDVYHMLVAQSTDWKEWVEPLKSTGPCPYSLARLVGHILHKRISQLGAELVMPTVIDDMVYETMQLLASTLRGVSLKRFRNQVEPSLTLPNLRPDMWVLAGGTMLFKGEDKTHDSDLPAAREDLLNKMKDWDYAYHGKVPYLPCYAAAGLKLQFFAIPRDAPSHLQELTSVLGVDDIFTRAHIIHVAMLLYCVIDGLAKLLPKDHMLLGQQQVRPFGTTITLLGTSVFKTVDLHANLFMAKIYGRMADVYKAQSKNLIAAESGFPIIVGGRLYCVQLKPMGQALTLATVPVHLLKTAVRCILQGLLALHKIGYAHGDLRWENIIWVSATQFVVIDLESTVALRNQSEQDALRTCSVRPRAWGPDLDVLVEGEFTEASDLCMLGAMLQEIHARHPAAVCEELMQGLLRKRWASVEEVEREAHEWLG